jgi:hypothetical protein
MALKYPPTTPRIQGAGSFSNQRDLIIADISNFSKKIGFVHGGKTSFLIRKFSWVGIYPASEWEFPEIKEILDRLTLSRDLYR